MQCDAGTARLMFQGASGPKDAHQVSRMQGAVYKDISVFLSNRSWSARRVFLDAFVKARRGGGGACCCCGERSFGLDPPAFATDAVASYVYWMTTNAL